MVAVPVTAVPVTAVPVACVIVRGVPCGIVTRMPVVVVPGVRGVIVTRMPVVVVSGLLVGGVIVPAVLRMVVLGAGVRRVAHRMVLSMRGLGSRGRVVVLVVDGVLDGLAAVLGLRLLGSPDVAMGALVVH